MTLKSIFPIFDCTETDLQIIPESFSNTCSLEFDNF
jgi:hypothetical protein